MSRVSKDALILTFGVVAVRTVAKGHHLVAEGNKMVAEGWEQFEKAVGEAGVGELPQLLRGIRSSLTPTPAPTPTEVLKAEAKLEEEEDEDQPGTSGISLQVVGGGGQDTPITIQIKDEVTGKVTYKYKCPQCDHIKISKRGLDSHIRSVHTKNALVCCKCDFTSYNLDSMQRHEREHK